MKKWMSLFITLLIILVVTACSEVNAGTTEEPGIVRIGEKINLKYIQHMEYQKYQIGYLGDDNELIWDEVGYSSELTVFLKKDISTPFLKRGKDVPDPGNFGDKPSYVMYIPKSYYIEGGTVKTGGKNPVSVPSQMIYSDKQ